MLVVIRGAGDVASSIALRLHRAGCTLVLLDVQVPTAVRRCVSFSEAIRLGETTVEGVRGVFCQDVAEATSVAKAGDIAVLVDPEGESIAKIKPDAVVDAILAKYNVGTTKAMAPIVIGVGPGFYAGDSSNSDCHAVIETKRGHYLGRAIYDGAPIPNTGTPGSIGGYTTQRVLRAPADGFFRPMAEIGDMVKQGDLIATVSGCPLHATIDGVLRGLLQEGIYVIRGMKSGDIDPRCKVGHCFSTSDKTRAVGGGVLEALLHFSGRLEG